MYSIQPYQHQDGTEREIRGRWPFASLSVGSQFIVPASERSRHHACRQAVSRYNKDNGTAIKCKTLYDGSMQVYIEGINESFVPEQSTTATNPTREQFNASLLALTMLQSFVIGPEYAGRFSQFNQWALELSESQPMQFDSERITEGLKLIRTL